MLGFFPIPYPDELLYSILARFYVWSANTSPKVALKEFFGRTSVVATFDLPSHLESLVQNLPVGSTHTASSFIQQNTLYPLYSPFLPLNRSKAVFDSMICHFSGDIHSRTGIMASTVPQIKFFRFCQICSQEDLMKYGELYWHRVHQIAGVLVCPVHQVWLQNSSVKVKGENRHEFYAADIENCIYKLSVVDYDKTTLDNLTTLAQDINKILTQSHMPHDGEWFRAKYQSLLIEKGLATPSARIYQKDLTREFIDFYGHEFLRLVHSEINIEAESSWLSAIVRKHRKVFHPIRHLLLIRFLNQDVPTFFENDIDSKPFGNGAWTCFNGASRHYLKKTITSVSVAYSHEVKKLVGTFSCSCGFVYSTSDSSVPYSDKLSIGKIKDFGSVWKRKLKKLLIENQTSFREAARQLKVDTKTVIRYAERLRLIDKKPKMLSKTQEGLNIESNGDFKEKYRREWLKAQKDFPLLSKTELRKLCPSVFMWLYRNDSKWLKAHSPQKRKIIKLNERVDWEKRDIQILKLSEICFAKLIEQDPPLRITVSNIGKKIGYQTILEKKLHKLPKTKQFYESNIETIEEFQIRRIKWAISKLITKDELPKPWKVVRLTGLKKDAANRLSSHIEQEIQKATLNKLQRRAG